MRLATGLPTSTITRFLEIPRNTWYYHRARTGRPNELWVTDITEMAHPSDAKVYLNPAIDRFDGRSVAWSSGLRPTSELADSRLESASGTLSPGEAPAVHNDRGVHHRTTSQIVGRESHGLRRSTSRKDMSCDSTRAEDSSACSSRISTTPRLERHHGRGVHGRAGPLDGVVSVGTHIAEAGLADTERVAAVSRLTGVGCTEKRPQSPT